MSKTLKVVHQILKPKPLSWVGNGFPVNNLWGPNDLGKHLNPFLLMDYSAPYKFEPAQEPRGIGMHPHRGFETVTISYSGEVAHKDSGGCGGVLKAGGLQWMTAGSGVMHQEMHSDKFTKSGGIFEAVQLWVNLPREHKYTDPYYQTIPDGDLPRLELPDGSEVRVVAGQFQDKKSPVKTFLQENIWDLRIPKGNTVQFEIPDGWTSGILLRRGKAKVNNSVAETKEVVVLEHAGSLVEINAIEPIEAVVLACPYLDEPIVARGPFVTSADDEMKQTRLDYRNGVFHNLKPARQLEHN